MFKDNLLEIDTNNAVNEVSVEFSAAPHLAHALEKYLGAILELWKMEHGDRSPTWYVPKGLLGEDYCFDSAKAYECTPHPVGSYGGLVLFLITSKYPPMLEAATKVSKLRLLAGAVMLEAHSIPIDHRALSDALELYKKFKLAYMNATITVMAPLATAGAKFRAGRQKGAFGPLRKVIAKVLAKQPDASAKQVWDQVSKKPPKGWTSMDSPRLGKYFEGPRANLNMNYRRFENVVSEERQKQKITG